MFTTIYGKTVRIIEKMTNNEGTSISWYIVEFVETGKCDRYNSSELFI